MNRETLVMYVLAALASLIALTVHEYSHAKAAWRLGDPTARNLGRLSLNPLRHLDPLGALCMVLFHFGWAKPVPVNARYFKNPKRDFAWVALAGPGVNLLLGFFTVPLYLGTLTLLGKGSFSSEFALALVRNTAAFLLLFCSVNIGLALFNLIPVPPLDGSRLLGAILPARAYFGIMKHERVIYWCLVGWLIGGGYLSDLLLSLPAIYSSPVLATLAWCLSLSNLLSVVFGAVIGAFVTLWQWLIPTLV